MTCTTCHSAPCRGTYSCRRKAGQTRYNNTIKQVKWGGPGGSKGEKVKKESGGLCGLIAFGSLSAFLYGSYELIRLITG